MGSVTTAVTVPRTVLGLLINRLGSQRAAAKHLGVTQAYVSAMMRGERPISEKVLSKLGFKRVVVQK